MSRQEETPPPSENGTAPDNPFAFLKGGEDYFKTKDGSPVDWGRSIELAREQLSEAMHSRNVAFLLGAGCSSYVADQNQLGIPTMQPLASEFANGEHDADDDNFEDQIFLTKVKKESLKDILGIDITVPEYAGNIERLMECLHSYQFALSRSVNEEHAPFLELVDDTIEVLQRFILDKCTEGAFSEGDATVAKIYEAFYRKLVFRDRSLPRPWVFTLNYDLFNETAMDRLGLPYCNGFSGTVERRFNPALFRYALAEQLDITSRKWSAVDGFVYLCKLHGSITWIEDLQGLFSIREKQNADLPDRVMIYPTPAKQNASLGSPYADLFREFHSRIVREQSVLFTVG